MILHVNRSYILLLLLFLGVSRASAQWNFESDYGNMNWISDALVPVDSTPHVGFRLLPQSDRRYTLRMQHPSGTLDSNSYSYMSYSIGSVASQNVVAKLVRPINDHQHIEFDFRRNSNPGWFESSFAREANVRLAFADYYDRFSYNAQVGGTFGDNEMNGGLRGTSYSISDNASATFGSLTSDVYTTNSFRKISDLRIKSAQEYQVNQGDTVQVSLRNELGVTRFLSRFEDNFINSGLYTGLPLSSSGVMVDSSFYWRVQDELSFNYCYKFDSVRTIRAKGGFTYEQVDLSQPNNSMNLQNWGVMSDVERINPIMPMELQLEAALLGYNSGSFHYRYHVTHNVVNIEGDSVKNFRFYYQFNVEGERTRLPLVFERYSNYSIQQRSNLDMFNQFRIDGGIGMELSRFDLGINVSSRNLDGYTYWNENWQVVQDSSIQNLLTGEVEAIYSGDDLNLGLMAQYQFNERSKIYSFPEWIFQGNIDYKLPWLRDRIKITLGSYARYFSNYYARGYHALLDVPYVQQSSKFGEYLQVDAYVKFDIKTVGIEIRSINSTYGILTDDPLIGPGYAMPPWYFMATFSWRFRN